MPYRFARLFGRCVLTLACLGPTALLANPVLSVGSATVPVGAQFDVAVSASGVDSALGLTAWQFDLAFDPTIVRVDSVSEGGFLAGFGSTLFSPGVIDNVGGLVSLLSDDYVDLLPAPWGTGVLAVFTFTALQAGQSALTLGSVFLNFGDAVAPAINGSVRVAAMTVPEPGTTGLAALAALIALCAAPRLRQTSHLCHPVQDLKELA